MSEEPIDPKALIDPSRTSPARCRKPWWRDRALICVHTYPESNPGRRAMHLSRRHISVNLQVISPLKLQCLIPQLESDVKCTIDYRVRRLYARRQRYETLSIMRLILFRILCPEDMKSLYDMVDVSIVSGKYFSIPRCCLRVRS